jgi:hypothetical protein
MARCRNGKVEQGLAPHDLPDLTRLPKSLVENARLEEDRRLHDRNVTDRRRSDRATVDGRATLGASPNTPFEGLLYGLSAEGCSLRLVTGSFNAGDAVWFTIETLDAFRGIVRWVDGDKVGVEFDRPFYQPLFELLVHSNKPVTVARAA